MTPVACPHCSRHVLAVMTAGGSTLLAEKGEERITVMLDGRASWGRPLHDCQPERPDAYVALEADEDAPKYAVARVVGRLWPHLYDAYLQACRECGAVVEASRVGRVNVLLAARAQAFAEILRGRGVEVKGAVL